VLYDDVVDPATLHSSEETLRGDLQGIPTCRKNTRGVDDCWERYPSALRHYLCLL